MKHFNKHFLATLGLGLLATSAAHAQLGVGTGSTAPRTMLDVNGAISVTETTAAVSSNAATISTGFSLVRLTGTATATVALTGATSPAAVPGQLVTIYNTTSFPATFNGQTIAAGQTLAFVYSDNGWQSMAGGGNSVTATNGLTKTGNTVALGGALTQATTVSNVTAATPLSVTSPTAADALLTIASTAGTGGGVIFGNTSHGVERGFPTPGADNNVGLFTTSANLYLSTNGRATGEFTLADNGYLGIGTATPGNKLQVVTTGGSGGTDDDYSYQTYTGTGAAASGIYYQHARGTLASPANLASGDLIYSQSGGGYINGGFAETTFFNSVYTGNGTTNRSVMQFGTSAAERMRISDDGNVGIGTTAPFAPLQFATATANRKVVLFDANSTATAGNDNQYYGFGVNTAALRYQTDNVNADHVFYAGVNSTTSNELFRVKGTGVIQVAGLGGTGTRLVTTDATGNLSSSTPASVLAAATTNTLGVSSNTLISTVNGVATTATVPNIYTANGTLASARTVTQGSNDLTFTGTGAFYKLSGAAGNTPSYLLGRTAEEAAFGVASAANQYLGGTVAGDAALRSSSGNLFVGTTGAFATVLGTSNAERMRITSAGNVGIGTTAPFAPLQFSNTTANRKVVLFDVNSTATVGNDNQYYGFGVNGATLRYQTDATASDHVFYAAASPTTSNELFRVKGTGAIKMAAYGSNGAANSLVTTTPNAYLAVAADGTIMQTANGNAPNIYTVDGTIINDRTITLGGKTINFQGSDGNFKFNATGNTFSTSANQLVITQTGDQYGSSSISLRNRNAQNGLLLTTADQTTGKSQVSVTDLFLQTQSNLTGYKQKQMNLRLESRAGVLVGPFGFSADSLELQIGKAVGVNSGPGLVVGNTYALAPNYFGVGSGGLVIGSRMTLTPYATESKITLYDGGVSANSTTAPVVPTTHYGFGVSSSQLNYDVMSGASHVFYTNSKNGSGTEIFRVASTGKATVSSNLNGDYALLVTNTAANAGGIDINMANNSATNASFQVFRNGGTTLGTITKTAASGINYNTTSDVRLKKDIVNTHYGLKDVMQIGVKDYVYKADKSAASQTGFIAQQLYSVYPIAVTKGGEDAQTNPWTVDYSKLTPLLTKAIQEEQAEIDALKAANAKLTSENTTLKANLDGKASASTLNEMQAALQALRAEVQTLKAGGTTASK